MPANLRPNSTNRPGSSSSQLSARSNCSTTGYTLKTWKIIVLGAPTTGKSSLVYRFTTGNLPDPANDNDLIPVFMEKKVKLPENEEQFYVSIWNLPAGAKQSGDVPKSFFDGSHGCLFVFSTVDQSSFTDLAHWFTAVTDYCGDIPVAFAENKIDLIDESVLNHTEVESMAKNYKLRLYRTSAKADHNVTELFNYLVSKIVHKYPDPSTVTSSSRRSSADSLRVRIGSESNGPAANCPDRSRRSLNSSASVDLNDADRADDEPSRRRTAGVKPIFNRHAIGNKKCKIM